MILVKRVDEVDADGELYSYLKTLGTDSVTLAPGYDFSKEPKDIYTTGDLCEFFPRREFSDQILSCNVPPTCVPATQPQPQTQSHHEPESPVIMINSSKVMINK